MPKVSQIIFLQLLDLCFFISQPNWRQWRQQSSRVHTMDRNMSTLTHWLDYSPASPSNASMIHAGPIYFFQSQPMPSISPPSHSLETVQQVFDLSFTNVSYTLCQEDSLVKAVYSIWSLSCQLSLMFFGRPITEWRLRSQSLLIKSWPLWRHFWWCQVQEPTRED